MQPSLDQKDLQLSSEVILVLLLSEALLSVKGVKFLPSTLGVWRSIYYTIKCKYGHSLHMLTQ